MSDVSTLSEMIHNWITRLKLPDVFTRESFSLISNRQIRLSSFFSDRCATKVRRDRNNLFACSYRELKWVRGHGRWFG